LNEIISEAQTSRPTVIKVQDLVPKGEEVSCELEGQYPSRIVSVVISERVREDAWPSYSAELLKVIAHLKKEAQEASPLWV
jgi:hypothetical protein